MTNRFHVDSLLSDRNSGQNTGYGRFPSGRQYWAAAHHDMLRPPTLCFSGHPFCRSLRVPGYYREEIINWPCEIFQYSCVPQANPVNTTIISNILPMPREEISDETSRETPENFTSRNNQETPKERNDVKEGSSRKRTFYTGDQLVALENEFKINRYLSRLRRIEVASRLQLTEKQIKVWFQNRRVKEKKGSGGDASKAEHYEVSVNNSKNENVSTEPLKIEVNRQHLEGPTYTKQTACCIEHPTKSCFVTMQSTVQPISTEQSTKSCSMIVNKTEQSSSTRQQSCVYNSAMFINQQ